jgi:two-component system nitrate/nitrite response regulator NarP
LCSSVYGKKVFRYCGTIFRASVRQREIISLVCDALSNKEIARKLGVTEGTIKTHLHMIYEKLGIQSRTELMATLSEENLSL